MPRLTWLYSYQKLPNLNTDGACVAHLCLQVLIHARDIRMFIHIYRPDVYTCKCIVCMQIYAQALNQFNSQCFNSRSLKPKPKFSVCRWASLHARLYMYVYIYHEHMHKQNTQYICCHVMVTHMAGFQVRCSINI
jgi:hypothetical protein